MALALRRWTSVGAVLVLVFVSGATGATAVTAGESIASYQAQVDVRRDGSMHIRETIEYVFVGDQKHGIYRDLRTRFTYDPDRNGADTVRVYPVEDVQVSSPSGAPTDVEVNESGDVTKIRIGSADTQVQGTQTYVLDYTVRGALNRITTDSTVGAESVPPHDELYWNITGAEWQVPIERARVSVSAPRAATLAQCYRGVQGSTDACDATAGATSIFLANGLQPGQGMSILLAYPTGTVADAGPIIEQRPAQGLAQLTQISPLAIGGSGLLFAGIAGAMVLLMRRRGRDSRFVGLTPGLLPVAGQSAGEELATRRGEVAVRFTPPDGLRPGQVGTLVDEQANTVDVTATIIDLAVRGYLRIEEVSASDQPDWLLRVVLPARSATLISSG